MKRITFLSLCALTILGVGTETTWAGSANGPVTACQNDPTCFTRITAVPTRESQRPNRSAQRTSHLPAGTTLPGGNLTLQAEIAGEWNIVDVNVVFAYDFSSSNPTIGLLQVFVRGWSGVRDGSSNRYRAQWDRAAYWIDFDGPGSGIPKLLPASELAAEYVPQVSNDPYPELASNPNVVAACTLAHPCSVQLSQYILLREVGVDYSSYPELAAPVDLLFVADDLGHAVAAVVDIYDENEQYVETKALTAGDTIEVSIQAYKIGEPQFIYLVGQMDFTPLQGNVQIQLANFVPGIDFVDAFLPSNLNAGSRRMKVMLDAYRATGNVWSFAGPFDLGFTWSQVLDFLHRDGFETPIPAPTRQFTLVQPEN